MHLISLNKHLNLKFILSKIIEISVKFIEIDNIFIQIKSTFKLTNSVKSILNATLFGKNENSLKKCNLNFIETLNLDFLNYRRTKQVITMQYLA